MRTPEPLHPNPKSIFEWFLNVYYWFGCAQEKEEDMKKASREAWLRVRRAHPDILQTKDKKFLLAWIPGDWEATHGSAGTAQSMKELLAIDVGGDDAPPPPPPPPQEEEEEEEEEAEEKREGGEKEEDVEDDDPVEPSSAAASRCFHPDSGELELLVERWSPAEVRDFILSRARARKKSEARLEAVARAAYEADVDGGLLVAGGPTFLMEQTVGRVKWDKSVLKSEANYLFEALKALQKRAEAASYYGRNPALHPLFATSCVRPALEAALAVQPREAIRYTVLCTRHSGDRATALPGVHEDVAKQVAVPSELFKVVSVVTPADTTEVWHNVVFYNDLATRRWVILASVDFQQHGEAPSGHWHLNRAPLGEFLPHWGPSNNVWHGSPATCPLWWLLIPNNFSYHIPPERAPLRGLLS